MTSQAERAHRFRSLHEGEPFVIPNPWDAGSARVLAALGFWELATTSSGLAMGLGRRDGQVTLDEVVAHVRALSAATDPPLSVDLEQGHGGSPGDAVRAIRAVAAAGAVGGSIEDWSAASGIDPVERGAERVAAAAEAAHGLDHDFVLTARAENHIRGRDDFDDTISPSSSTNAPERTESVSAAGWRASPCGPWPTRPSRWVTAVQSRPSTFPYRSTSGSPETTDIGCTRPMAWTTIGSREHRFGVQKMPQYMDFHDDLKLPQDAIDDIARGAHQGRTDEFGVRQVELYHNADGKVFCLLDAPNEQAVRDHHEALGVSCGDVHEVHGIA